MELKRTSKKKPLPTKARKGRGVLGQLQCVNECEQRVITNNGCVCQSNTEINTDSSNRKWCYVHCPPSVPHPPYTTLLTQKPYDYISVLKPRKTCLADNYTYAFCSNSSGTNGSDETRTKKKKRRAESFTKAQLLDRNHRFLIGIFAWRFLAHIFSKTQTSNEAVRRVLYEDMQKTIEGLANYHHLSPEIQKELHTTLDKVLNKTISLRTILTEYRMFLNAQSSQSDKYASNDQVVVDAIVDILDSDEKQLSEFLRGAQIQIRGDHGNFYEQISQRKGAFSRISSHHPTVSTVTTPHRAVSDTIFGRTYHLLTGKTASGDTWLQMEASPWAPGVTWLEVGIALVKEPKLIPPTLDHAVDFVVHKATRRNIGPVGSSEFGEWNPIQIEKIVKQVMGTTLQEQQIGRLLETLSAKQIKQYEPIILSSTAMGLGIPSGRQPVANLTNLLFVASAPALLPSSTSFLSWAGAAAAM